MGKRLALEEINEIASMITALDTMRNNSLSYIYIGSARVFDDSGSQIGTLIYDADMDNYVFEAGVEDEF